MMKLGYSMSRHITTAHLHMKMCLLALTLPFLASTTSSLVVAQENENANAQYAIGLWGDLPYSEAQEVGVIRLINDMNSQKLSFTVHNGDLKAGSNSLCDNALYTKALGYFNDLEAPAVFTPGDNDWTDCDRPSNGGFNSRERLDYERMVFFSTNFSLGQRRLAQEVQTAPLCLGVKGAMPCSENRRWTVGRVTYATLNIQGSCNNLCDTAPDESTTQPPSNDYIPQEYIEIDPVTAYCNWVLGKPFKDSIAKLDKAGVIAYVNEMANSVKPLDLKAKSFWAGYKAGIQGTELNSTDEIFIIGYNAATGNVKPPAPKRKPKN